MVISARSERSRRDCCRFVFYRLRSDLYSKNFFLAFRLFLVSKKFFEKKKVFANVFLARSHKIYCKNIEDGLELHLQNTCVGIYILVSSFFITEKICSENFVKNLYIFLQIPFDSRRPSSSSQRDRRAWMFHFMSLSSTSSDTH